MDDKESKNPKNKNETDIHLWTYDATKKDFHNTKTNPSKNADKKGNPYTRLPPFSGVHIMEKLNPKQLPLANDTDMNFSIATNENCLEEETPGIKSKEEEQCKKFYKTITKIYCSIE